MLTDAINLILIDTENDSYINRFTIKMLPPTTQEEVDRRENLANKVSLISDIMNVLTDVDDPVVKLRILKSMLATTLTDGEVVEILQEQIDKLMAEQESTETPIEDESMDDENLGDLFDTSSSDNFDSFDMGNTDVPEMNDTAVDSSEFESEDETLPSPADLDIGDLSDSSNPNLD